MKGVFNKEFMKFINKYMKLIFPDGIYQNNNIELRNYFSVIY